MIYIVDIRAKAGNIAREEYDARSLRDVLQQVDHELTGYPQCYVNDIWPKGSPLPGLMARGSSNTVLMRRALETALVCTPLPIGAFHDGCRSSECVNLCEPSGTSCRLTGGASLKVRSALSSMCGGRSACTL